MRQYDYWIFSILSEHFVTRSVVFLISVDFIFVRICKGEHGNKSLSLFRGKMCNRLIDRFLGHYYLRRRFPNDLSDKLRRGFNT